MRHWFEGGLSGLARVMRAIVSEIAEFEGSGAGLDWESGRAGPPLLLHGYQSQPGEQDKGRTVG